MVRTNDHWRCTYCGGDVYGVAPDAEPQVHFQARGGKPTERVVTVERVEVHRCAGPPRH
jgi:hypothetical protein